MNNIKNTPGKRSKVESEQTRRKILEAGLHLFAQKGYGGVSIRDVAAAAGVRHGTIQHHFGSKQGLYDAAVHLYDDELKALIPSFFGMETNFLKVLDIAVDTIFDFLLERRDWLVLRARIVIASDSDENEQAKGSNWIEFIDDIFKDTRVGPINVDIGLLIISIEAMLTFHLLADSHFESLYGKSIDEANKKDKSKAHLKKMVTAMFIGVL